MRRVAAPFLLLLWVVLPVAAQLPTIREASSGFTRQEGHVPLLHDVVRERLWIELPDSGLRTLFLVTLATGLGSNPIGLDRGAGGSSQVVRFERTGARMRMVFENWRYRSSGDALHARTVQEAFSESPVASLTITAAEGGRVLVDVTDLVFRDWNNIVGTLQQTNEGTWLVSRERSGIHLPYTKAFPRNTEIDIELALTTSARGGRITGQLLPDATAMMLRQHLTFFALPDDSYQPRAWDPRTGFFGPEWKDYFQPIDGRLDRRVINRHRLQRRDPADPRSPFVAPIVFYIDPGIPEPVRTATWEGARWWEEAFAQAGLAGGFRVEWLPPDVDPMDARYNVVQWENRNERGWSIGGSISDPRTGEMLKGMARMDSHRARTDYNLYAALRGATPGAADTAFVLARVRQVTAHEIGHTIGLAHNYIASTYDRGSVMDYPTPRVRVVDGEIDMSQAYATGPGSFDVWAIRWGYGIWPPSHEADSLRAIVADGLARGYRFLSDGDARPASAADPRTNLWDDAATAGEFLTHQLDVRRLALGRFGLANIRPGEPVGLLEERLAPLYFWHRFAITALARTIGGLEYHYAVSGDGQTAVRPLSGRTQRGALLQLMRTLAPAELALPDTVVRLLPPPPGQLRDPVEAFRSRTAPMFDELGAARTLAQHVVDEILQRERAARLVTMSARNPETLSLGETIDVLVRVTWSRTATSSHHAALRRLTGRAVVDRLLALAADQAADQQVRDLVAWKLASLGTRAGSNVGVSGDDAERAHWSGIARDIARWLERRELPTPTPALTAPPFDPFGSDY